MIVVRASTWSRVFIVGAGACHFCGGMSDWRVREKGVDVVPGKVDGPVWIDVVCDKVLGRDDTE